MTTKIENQPKIYLTNLGKYTEGEHVGQWLNVPCSNDEFKQTLLNIGVDGVQYEEYFITDFEYLNGVSEYSNIQEVNEIAKFSLMIDSFISEDLSEQDKSFIRTELLENVNHLMKYENLEVEEVIEKLESYKIFTQQEHTNALQEFGYYLLEELNFYNYDTLNDDIRDFIDIEKIGRINLHSFDVIAKQSYGKLDEITTVLIVEI